MTHRAKVKELMIQFLGTRVSAVIHGVRFAMLATDARFADREIAIVRRYLKSGDVAVDVGANGADWTRQLSRIVGKGGAVYAFEADPYYAEATLWACRSLRLSNVVLFPFGLSDRFEHASLNAMDVQGARASGVSAIDRNVKEGKFVYSVELRPMDSLIHDWPRIPDCRVIKIDVEGFELFVLRGARETIERSRPVIIFEVGRFDEQGYGTGDVIKFFEELDYRSFYVDAGGRLMECDESLSIGSADTVNRIALPRELL